MTITLNEREWAKEHINSYSLGDKPFETFTRVARYYLDDGMQKKDVRKKMDEFLIQCDPSASLPKWSDTLDRAVSKAVRCEAISIEYIPITKPEMDVIDSLDGIQVRRLAFALLCLSKYWDVINPSGNHWVNTKDSEIMKMANIGTSIRRQCGMYRDLKSAGLVQFSKKVDNTNVRVCFVEDGDVVLKITDFRNLGYQYLKYHGEPYFECQNCGITVKYNDSTNTRNQKYCKDCATEVAVKQRINSVMKLRNK